MSYEHHGLSKHTSTLTTGKNLPPIQTLKDTSLPPSLCACASKRYTEVPCLQINAEFPQFDQVTYIWLVKPRCPGCVCVLDQISPTSASMILRHDDVITDIAITALDYDVVGNRCVFGDDDCYRSTCMSNVMRHIVEICDE